MTWTRKNILSERLLAIPNDASISSVTHGLIATTVSYAGPLLVVFQAAKVANLGDAQLSSWIWAISLGSALTGIILSMWYKIPIITAWSTPGAALLVSGWAAYSYPDAIGAFIFSAIMMIVFGFTGWFSYLMEKIPSSIVSAMLAGILLSFGVDLFDSLGIAPFLVFPMLISYLLAKRWIPRYSVVVTLFVGILFAILLGRLHFNVVKIALVKPVFTLPHFDLGALIGLGLPLFIVTMTSQNAAGIAVLRGDGFDPPINPIVTITGIASLLLAPFGSHAINLAAITAAICTGKDVHENPRKRYVAGIATGLFYLVLSMFGTAIVFLFSAFPEALVTSIAGLALLSSLGSSLSSAMSGNEKESGLVTFLITVSGISILGIGAAFWGLLGGLITYYILHGSSAVAWSKLLKSKSQQDI